MNIIKSFFIGILLCMSILSKGQTQELEIALTYNRQDNALTLKLYNNTDKEIMILNQSLLNESSGSCIILTEKQDNGQSDLIISLYDYEDGQWIRSKTINPNERLELFYPFKAIPANNVTRARLFLSTYFRDRKTGQLVSKKYKNDLPIKQIK